MIVIIAIMVVIAFIISVMGYQSYVDYVDYAKFRRKKHEHFQAMAMIAPREELGKKEASTASLRVGPRNVPTRPGWYLARRRDVKWLHCLVRIEGEAPYLHYSLWDMIPSKTTQCLEHGIDPYNVIFGPELIPDPDWSEQ